MMPIPKREQFIRYGHLLALFCLAVPHPLLDLLARHAEFFVVRKSEPADLVMMAGILYLLLPLPLILIEFIAERIHSKAGQWVHRTWVGLLAGLIILSSLKSLESVPGMVLVLASVLSGAGFAFIYARYQPIKLFVTCLAPVLIISPAYFFLTPAITKVAFPSQSPVEVHSKIEAKHPIFMLVLDELPLVSLLDENHQIDPVRYPNFAALAQDSYWFRNATTISAMTHYALPSILTGRYPHKKAIPVLQEYPDNLFTLLRKNYEIIAYEPATQLCPKSYCKTPVKTIDFKNRLVSLFQDVTVIYLYSLLPSEFYLNLPNIAHTWKGFGKAGKSYIQNLPRNSENVDEIDPKKLSKELNKKVKRNYTEDRYQRFDEFIQAIRPSQKPVLYFNHVFLPHKPWQYYPSGKIYSLKGYERLDCLGPHEEYVCEDEERIAKLFQRHLLQVGFADLLIGKFISKIKSEKLYDQALIVVVADHGVGFKPKDGFRIITPTNIGHLLPIPLFIKAPFQKKGVQISKNVEIIDIVPTMADLLKIQIPWDMDGSSAVDPSFPDKKYKTVFNYYKKADGEKFTFKAEAVKKEKDLFLKKKIQLFGSGESQNNLFRFGPNKEMHGMEVLALGIEGQSAYKTNISNSLSLEDVSLDSDFIPGKIAGIIYSSDNNTDPINIAVSLNGFIQATTKTSPFVNGKAKYISIVPEGGFKAGRNLVELFQINNKSDKNILKRIPEPLRDKLYIKSYADREEIASRKKAAFRVIPNALRGYLEIASEKKDNYYFSGNVEDLINKTVPDKIFVFKNGSLVYSGWSGLLRPDIAKHFKEPGFKHSGFYFEIPKSKLGSPADSELRFFVASNKGIASEFVYFPDFQWKSHLRKKTINIDLNECPYSLKYDNQGERLISAQSKEFKIIRDSFQLDLQLKAHGLRDNILTLEGWTVSQRYSKIPEKIIVFVNDKCIYSGIPHIPKKNVSDWFKNKAFLNSGFKLEFPREYLGKIDKAEIRIFAAENDLATEAKYPKDYPWPRKRKPLNKPKNGVNFILSKLPGGKEVVTEIDGEVSYLITNNTARVRGLVDKVTVEEDRVVFDGFAIDLYGKSPAEKVLIFANKKFLFMGYPELPRYGVSKFHKHPNYEKSGYHFEFPLSSLPELSTAKIRLFALSKTGQASELWYAKDYPFK